MDSQRNGRAVTNKRDLRMKSFVDVKGVKRGAIVLKKVWFCTTPVNERVLAGAKRPYASYANVQPIRKAQPESNIDWYSNKARSLID